MTIRRIELETAKTPRVGRTVSRFLFGAALFALGGCTTTPDATLIGPKPTGYKEAIRVYAKTAFFDSYSLQDVAIAPPIPVSAIFDGITPIPCSGWMTCLRANGKNRFGGYTGLQLTGFLFVNGVITTAIGEEGAGQLSQVYHHCAAAVYEPFQITDGGRL
jgi:hypothetical protein